jgi:hypothetical protein
MARRGCKWLYQQLQSLHVAGDGPISPPACSPSCSPTATYHRLANARSMDLGQAAELVPAHCRRVVAQTDPVPPPEPALYGACRVYQFG